MADTTASTPVTINLFADREGRSVYFASINRDLITKHSKAIKRALDASPSATDIVITGAAKGPLEHVIGFIKNGKQPLRIGVGEEPFPRAIAILQAVNALDVEPAQPQVENRIMYAITQFKMTTEQVHTIEQASNRLGTDSRIYKAMVQAVAYNYLHNGFTPAEKEAMKEAALKYPDLHKMIGGKMKDLQRRREEHEERVAETEARKEARRRRLAERDERYQFY